MASGTVLHKLACGGRARSGRKEILEAPWTWPRLNPPPPALWLPFILKDFLVHSLLFAEMGRTPL